MLQSLFSSLRRRSGFIIATTMVLLGLSITVRAQKCPAYLGPGLPLTNPSTATVSCTTSQGRTICSLWCTYSITRTDLPDTADIKLQWVSEKLRADAPILEDSCGPGLEIINGKRHANRQAIIRWAGSNSNLENSASIEAANLLRQVENAAVGCSSRPDPVQPMPSASPPPIGRGCEGSRPAARIIVTAGSVDIYSHAFNKWKGPYRSAPPVFKCDYVRTGPNSEASVFIYLPSGLEDRVNMLGNTILEIPGPSEFSEIGESSFVDLIKGTIRWLTEPEQEQRYPGPFNVRTPTVTTGRHGTDFVIHHDPAKKQDFVFLNSGKIELSAGGRKLMLQPGQQIFTENGQLSPVYEMSAATWTSITGRNPISWTNIFATAKRISPDAGKPESGKMAAKDFSESNIGGRVGPIYNVLFRGQNYRTFYEKQQHEGVPIDTYFFEIIGPDGRQAEQNGAKLWGRFVRVPAADSPNATSVEWWHATWVQRGGVWEQVDTKGAQFEVLGSAATDTPGAKSDNAKETAADSPEPGYGVRFQGRMYQTIYRRETDQGIPIDIYYYPINRPDGTQATQQNGDKIWGRFVRKPAADFPNATSVDWYHATWVNKAGVWEQVSTKVSQFEVLGKLP